MTQEVARPSRTEQTAAHGVRFVDDGGVQWFEVYDVAAFRRGIGDDLIVAFSRAFAVADRLATVGDLMALNSRELPAVDSYPGTEHSPNSVSGERILEHLVAWQWGLLYEACEVIDDLVRANVDTLVAVQGAGCPEAWAALIKMRDYWNTTPHRQLRNRLHGHAGDATTHKRGLDASDGQHITLMGRQQSKRVHLTYALGRVLLARGMGFETADWERVADAGQEDHFTFGEHVMIVFCGVLNARGCHITLMLSRP